MKYIFSLLLLIGGNHFLFAQTEERADSLDQVVISANKTTEMKRDLPNQIEVVTARQIRQLSPMTTADALQNSGTLFVQKSQQGGGSPVIRGFEANKVLLVVDGVRMNNAIYRSGHLQNIITLDPNALERIEVLYGAGSVVYGTDAIGGVISVYTKRPELSLTDKTTYHAGGFVRYAGANNGLAANASLNIGGRKWANFLSVTASDFGDLVSGKNDLKDYPDFGDKPFYVERLNGRDSILVNDNPDKQIASGYRQIDILEKLRFVASERWQHTLNFQYSNSTNVPRYDRLTELAGGKPRFAEWYYGPQQRLLASYQMEFQPGGGIADLIRLTPAFQKVEESRYDRRLNAAGRNERVEKLNAFSVNLDFFKNIGQHELRYGAEFVHNKLESDGVLRNVASNETKPLVSRYPDGTYRTFGIFASHSWEILGKKLILSDGLRYSRVRMDVAFDPGFYEIANLRQVEQSSSSFNYNLGLTSNLPSGFRVSAMLSTGFRNPNIDDAGKIFENAAGTLNIPNANLKPEQVLHRELSLGQQLGKTTTLEATVFYSTLSDAIATRPTTYNGNDYIVLGNDTLTPVRSENVAKARVWGLSLRGKWRLAQYFLISGSLMYTEGRDQSNDVPLDHIPPLVGNLRLGYDNGPWLAETDVLFNGWKHLKDYSPSGEDNLQYATPEGMPSWATWNLRAGRSLLDNKLRLQVAVENILDLNYRVFAGGINAPGRNFVVGLHWNL